LCKGFVTLLGDGNGILCILDIRMIEASLLAEKLGLRFLNSATTRMARDKFSVREALARHGVRQPEFALAQTVDDVRRAVADIGFPVLVKPSDGYGSQNVSAIFSDADLQALIGSLENLALHPTDYGLGVHANNRFSVEKYIRGHMIGCDVFTGDHERILLGINDKLMFPPPSFAMRGSCFPSDRYDRATICEYAFQILDAINFDFGASHIEMIVAENGPYLVEVNPRLVSAQIPHQMGYALERSIYADLINLHLGEPLTDLRNVKPRWFSAIRWVVANRPGLLQSVELPTDLDPSIRRVVLFKACGDAVRPPVNNGDRIGYVIAVGNTQAAAEQMADQYVQDSAVHLQ
jgi:biotin carboxylase